MQFSGENGAIREYIAPMRASDFKMDDGNKAKYYKEPGMSKVPTHLNWSTGILECQVAIRSV